jgi:hypothetical protein
MKTSITISCRKFSGINLKFVVIALFLLPLNIFSQQILSYEQNVPIESGKKKKIMKDLNEWATSQTNLSLKQTGKEDELILNGAFSFENPVKYEASATYSRMYASQTNGKISYELNIQIKDDHLLFKVYNFKHIPAAKGERIEFGQLTSSEAAPENLKMDYDAAWCDKVWASMKKMAEDNSTKILGQLPSNLMTAR